MWICNLYEFWGCRRSHRYTYSICRIYYYYIYIWRMSHTRRGTHAILVYSLESSWIKRRHRANRTTGVHQLNEPFSNCPSAIGTVSTITKSPLLSIYIPLGATALHPSLFLAHPLSGHLSRSPADCMTIWAFGYTDIWLYGWPRKVSVRATNLNLIKRQSAKTRRIQLGIGIKRIYPNCCVTTNSKDLCSFGHSNPKEFEGLLNK